MFRDNDVILAFFSTLCCADPSPFSPVAMDRPEPPPNPAATPARVTSSSSPTYPLGQVNTRLAADVRQTNLPYTVGEVEK